MNAVSATSTIRSEDKSAVLIPAVLAALLGAFLILGPGVAQIAAVHNAAHDTRHAFAFPCH
jgi:cobalt transporter subunit CbtB